MSFHKTSPMAAQRDRSFHRSRSSGNGGKWHLVGTYGGPRCNGVPLLCTDEVRPARTIPAIMRCKRCIGWPADLLAP